MILMIVTVCLLADPVTVECQTNVTRMDRTAVECLELIQPTVAFMAENTVAMPVVAILAACKGGTVL